MVFAMFSTIYYNIARKRDATASDSAQFVAYFVQKLKGPVFQILFLSYKFFRYCSGVTPSTRLNTFEKYVVLSYPRKSDT